jgi:hypothetical protein
MLLQKNKMYIIVVYIKNILYFCMQDTLLKFDKHFYNVYTSTHIHKVLFWLQIIQQIWP